MASVTARRSVLRGRPPNLGGGQKGRDHRPFLIRHVTRISGRHTPVVVASDLVPGHLILRLPTRRGNHNPLMPLNSFSARLSAWLCTSRRSAGDEQEAAEHVG